MEKESVASKVSECIPTVLSGCMSGGSLLPQGLADGNPYTKTTTGTTPQELKKVEARKML